MPKTIAVLGATGNQGGSVATYFHSLGWTVRGISRNAESTSAQSLISKGISVAEADVDNPTTLLPAFRGAHVIFVVTDFCGPFRARFEELKKVSDTATGQYAYDAEAKRGKVIIDAIATVLGEKDSVLERFVFSTLPNFKEQSGGKYKGVFHYDSKAVATKYLKEKDGGKLWQRSSLLNMGFYMNNMIEYGPAAGAAKALTDGKYILSTPCSPNALHPFVEPRDVGIFVELLARSPPQQDFLAVSETATFATYMKIWNRVTGVPGEAREITIEEADRDAPGGIGKEAAEAAAVSAEFGWGKDLVLPKDLDPTIKTTSLREYMEGEDWKTYLSKF